MSEARFEARSRTPLDATWQRWRMTALDAPVAAAETPDPEAAHEAARQAGFEAGWQAGFEEGRAAGHAEGLTAGRDAGHGEGHAEGHAAGLAAGQIEGQAIAREQAERLTALVTDLAQSLRALEADVGQSLLALAVDIAKKIVGDTLAECPGAVLHGVRETLALAGDAAPVSLWLHPDDLALINTYLNDELRDELKRGDARILPDATLARGDCRAETALGEIDATLATRWQRASAALLGSA